MKKSELERMERLEAIVERQNQTIATNLQTLEEQAKQIHRSEGANEALTVLIVRLKKE